MESEIRFLLFFNFVQKLFQIFKNCNSEKQLLDLMSTNNDISLKKLVQFIYNNFKKRLPFLDRLIIFHYLLSTFLFFEKKLKQ